MTPGEIFLAVLVLLLAIGIMLAVFYLWFSVWKYVSDHSGNIVEWEDRDLHEVKSSDMDAVKRQ
jgi:hypothetical protein